MNQSKKVAFITGANRGIGFETARELAENGIQVVIAARDATKGKMAAKKLQEQGYEAESLQFDITNTHDHTKALNYLTEKFGRLDILVNNAGVMIELESGSSDRSNRTSKISSDILHQTFETNFFAPVALTQTLLPLLRQSPAGRIVNLSSILGSLALHTDPDSPIYESKVFAYDASKTALNAFTIHLAHELKDTHIKVNSAHPGWVKTEMGGTAAPLEVSEGSKTSVQLALLPDNGPTGGFFHLGTPLPW